LYAIATSDPHERFVLKRHRDDDAFYRELFTFRALESTTRTRSRAAALVAADGTSMSLLMEFVPTTVSLRDARDFESACRFMGHVHGTLGDLADVLQGDLGFPTAERLCSSRSTLSRAGTRDVEALRVAVIWMVELFGPRSVPCNVGDMKSGHLRQRRDGSLALVDLETFAGGLPQTIDVLMLLNLVERRRGKCPFDHEVWVNGCAAYLDAARRGSRTRKSDARDFFDAVRMTAKAFGLDGVVPTGDA
jgi:hypothetical protein